jgi:hypothetical protein
MPATLQRTWDEVVDCSQIVSRTCADRDCGRVEPSWLKIRRKGLRIEDSWFCSPECIGRAVQTGLQRCIKEVPERPHYLHRMPLGLLMLSRGFVDAAQVRSALLAQQRERRDKIGQWLQRMGFATERQVVTALALQYATPVLAFPAEVFPQGMLPLVMLKSLRILPVRFSPSQRLLYVAFCSPVDHMLLQSIEKITGWRTSACVISDVCMTKLLEDADERDGGRTHYFARVSSAEEITRITLSYAMRVNAREIRFAKCRSLIWVRLRSHHKTSDLVFDSPVSSSQQSHSGPHARLEISAGAVLGAH